jgi:hypothetical protein
MIRAVTKKPLHRTYSHESLRSALKIISTGISIRKASIYYGIPRSTLQDHVSGRSTQKKGCPNVIPKPEEKIIVAALINV